MPVKVVYSQLESGAVAPPDLPEAFERGRPFNAFATCAGFFLAFVLAEGG